jgi:hypothetical protein
MFEKVIVERQVYDLANLAMALVRAERGMAAASADFSRSKSDADLATYESATDEWGNIFDAIKAINEELGDILTSRPFVPTMHEPGPQCYDY